VQGEKERKSLGQPSFQKVNYNKTKGVRNMTEYDIEVAERDAFAWALLSNNRKKKKARKMKLREDVLEVMELLLSVSCGFMGVVAIVTMMIMVF
jgi:hypothetical protein